MDIQLKIVNICSTSSAHNVVRFSHHLYLLDRKEYNRDGQVFQIFYYIPSHGRYAEIDGDASLRIALMIMRRSNADECFLAVCFNQPFVAAERKLRKEREQKTDSYIEMRHRQLKSKLLQGLRTHG